MKILFLLVFPILCLAQTTEVLYLSGVDKDQTVLWDFYCSHGRNSGKWSKIAVPSNWELQGFGHYSYGKDDQLSDESGLYRHTFVPPAKWKGKTVYLVFEGSMTDTHVKLNGKSAGPVHQGGFYRFHYDVTNLLRYGAQNLLEVTVNKSSANASVNEAERKADYWVFGGIYRPVYLQAFPPEFIEQVAIDARADGSFCIHVFPRTKSRDTHVEVQLRKDGNTLPQSWRAARNASLVEGRLEDAALWSPEFPHLYTAIITLRRGEQVLHRVEQRFGFRSIEVRPSDGIYVNNKKIMFRGVCRHSFWPESGRTTSKALSIADVNLIKDMNMNAVRMSHYPPDSHFLDVCDSLGLFVIDELAGWQYPPYDTEVGKKLVQEMVCRDVNHPCILLWANGNESGFNYDLLPAYHKYDVQQRPVIHPWENIHGLDTFHYFPYDYGIQSVFHGKDIFFPTEILHGWYDGGGGAGLDDYWNLMLQHPLSAGAFLWVFCDEGVVRRDLNNSIDTRGHMGADGILGPYREKEASFYTIRDIWSPIQFVPKIITEKFDGTLQICNRFDDTNLQQCRFQSEWIRFNGIFPMIVPDTTRWPIPAPDVAPKAEGKLSLPLPPNWRQYDAFYISATDPHGRTINRWGWTLSSPAAFSSRNIQVNSAPVYGIEDGKEILLSSADVKVTFDKTSGLLLRIEKGQQVIPLSRGPRFIGFEATFKELKLTQTDKGYTVQWFYDEKIPCHASWTMLPGGNCFLEYDFRPVAGGYELLGITFSFPESLVTGARLLANGPYRVWKNRLRGPLFGLYDKEYNDTVTGESWEYPEFKGYYANFYAVEVKMPAASFSILSASDDLFLHLFTPKPPKGAPNDRVIPIFPDGDLSILHTIPPIGNKSHPAELTGPQGWPARYQPNRSTKNLQGKLYFVFSENTETESR